MSNVVDISGNEAPQREPTEIEAAVQRMMRISLSPYLPDNLRADLDLLIKASLSWNYFQQVKNRVENA